MAKRQSLEEKPNLLKKHILKNVLQIITLVFISILPSPPYPRFHFFPIRLTLACYPTHATPPCHQSRATADLSEEYVNK